MAAAGVHSRLRYPQVDDAEIPKLPRIFPFSGPLPWISLGAAGRFLIRGALANDITNEGEEGPWRKRPVQPAESRIGQ